MPRSRTRGRRPDVDNRPRRANQLNRWIVILPLLALLGATLIGLFGNSFNAGVVNGAGSTESVQPANP